MSGSSPLTRPWWIVFILFAASVLNYVDRVSISVLSPQIRQEFGLTNSDYALAVGTFLFVYTVALPLAGWLVDKAGYRLGFSLSITFWSIANLLHTLVRGLGSLCFFRGLLAIGEACYYPAGMKAISQNFDSKDRSKAVSLLLLGLSVGVTVAVPLIGALTLKWGWRSSFVVTSLIGFALILPWHIVHSTSMPIALQRSAQAPSSSSAPNTPEAISNQQAIFYQSSQYKQIKFYLHKRELWILFCARALGDSVWYFYIFWMPAYLVQNRGFNLKLLAQCAWIPFLAADLGGLLAGWISSRLIQAGWTLNNSRKTVLAGSALLLPAGTLAYFVSSIPSSILLLSLATFGIMAYGTILLTIPVDIFPHNRIALVMGIVGCSGSLSGACFQYVVGRLVDQSSYLPVFLMAGLFHPIAAFLVIFGIRNIVTAEYDDNIK
jgi:MFS transporter, ACS family, hexuronate transporter